MADIITDILLNESGTYDDFWLELRYEREQQQRQDSEDSTERQESEISFGMEIEHSEIIQVIAAVV